MKRLFISLVLSLAVSVTAMAAEGGTQEPAQEAGYAEQYEEDAPIDDESEPPEPEGATGVIEDEDVEAEDVPEEAPEAGDIEEEELQEEEEGPDMEEAQEETESEEELEELARLDASALRNTFRKVGIRTYYYNEKGIRVTGWNKIGGKTYYMGPTGAIQTGWKTLSGKKYYFWPDAKRYGWMATGWPVIKGSHYYMGSDGAMRTGWQTVNGFKYYMEDLLLLPQNRGQALQGHRCQGLYGCFRQVLLFWQGLRHGHRLADHQRIQILLWDQRHHAHRLADHRREEILLLRVYHQEIQTPFQGHGGYVYELRERQLVLHGPEYRGLPVRLEGL